MGQFILGDCMDLETGLPSYPDKFFDLAVVDPPYGIDKAFTPNSRISKYGQTITANDNKPDVKYFEELFRVSKNQIIVYNPPMAQNISQNDFQKEVLKKTFAKYDLDTEKVIALCRNHRKRLETSPAFIS